MSRVDRGSIAALAVAAILLGINLVPGVGTWLHIWQAFDAFNLALTEVQVAPDRRQIDVGFTLWNSSDVEVRVVSVLSVVAINGTTVASGRMRPPDVTLSGGVDHVLRVTADVADPNRAALESRLGGAPVVWSVAGQVEVRVPGVRGTTLVPYSGRIDQP